MSRKRKPTDKKEHAVKIDSLLVWCPYLRKQVEIEFNSVHADYSEYNTTAIGLWESITLKFLCQCGLWHEKPTNGFLQTKNKSENSIEQYKRIIK